MNPQISIIIPVYNSAPTIERCIDSILRQDFTDFEVLLVNDGSADNSLEVMHQQALRDSRIVAIDKPHSGVSDTRNLALDKARGEYVCFIDADDTVESNYLSAMYAHRDCDMVICGYFVDWLDKDKILIRQAQQELPLVGQFDVTNACDSIYELFANGKIHINCNKLLKKSIIDSYNLRYTTIPVNEDYMFMIEYLKHAKSVYATEEVAYHWWRVQGIRTGVDSMPPNLLDIYILAYKKTRALFCNGTLVDKIFYYTFEFVVRKYMTAAKNHTITRNERNDVLKHMFSLPEVKDCWKAHEPSGMGERIMMTLLKWRLFGLYQNLFIR